MVCYIINDLLMRAKTVLMEIYAGAASDGDVRLVNGYFLNEGRVEIYHK